MKIAVFTDVFLEVPGGIPSSITAQKESLEKLGHQVTIFCPGTEAKMDEAAARTAAAGAEANKAAAKTASAAAVKAKMSGVITVPTHKFLRLNGAPVSKSPKKVERFIKAKIAGVKTRDMARTATTEIGVADFSEFDLVHVHYEASCSLAGMRLAREYKLPLVQTMHGREDMAIAVNVPHPFKTITACLLNFLHGRYIPHTKKVKRDSVLAPTIARAKIWTLMVNHANFADVVITPSLHFARKLEKYGVIRPIKVVSNGVADELVAELDKKVRTGTAKETKANETGRKTGVSNATESSLIRKMEPGEPLKLFWNSRVSNEKRIMPFLEALKIVNEKIVNGVGALGGSDMTNGAGKVGKSGGFFFSVCGDGNALKAAEKFVAKNGLEGRVKFYGRVPHDEMLDKMLDQHLSVTVSYGFDTQGLTLLEAEATGMPVFFCDPDMEEIVPNAGAVIAEGPEPELMAEALIDVIKHPEEIEKMSRVMLEHRTEVLQSQQVKKLLEAYQLAV